MVQGKVEICGVNTAKLPLLKAADKDALFAKIREGDTAARETYIEGNLRLVLSVIKRFSSSAENVDDLFQIGCIGLIKAIDNFDPAQNVRFSTYGVPMIIGEIRRFLRDNNALRVSRSLRDTAYKAMQARERLEKQLGREPTVDEIAQKTGLSRREVSAALESVVEPLSLEEPVYADGGDAVYVIDQVRARAHMPGITIGGLDAMREAVRYERRVEFPVEAVNFFDEVRWGTYKETKFQGQDVHGGQSWWGDNTVEYAWYWDDCLWPWSVPQGELQRNASLTTRPGWVY